MLELFNTTKNAMRCALVFSLVLCFLPGIFVVTLGPIFLQFLNLADGVSRTR